MSQGERAEVRPKRNPSAKQPKRHAAPAGWPPSDEPAAAPAPALTVHDLYSGAPVVTEAPAGDGGLQSLHDSHATWSRRVKSGSANGHPSLWEPLSPRP